MSYAAVFVSCYTDFSNLAHQPQGKEAKHPILSLFLNTETGQLSLVSVLDAEGCDNPAFLRYHPVWNTLYAATETIDRDGDVFAIAVSNATLRMQSRGSQPAQGKSTCYLFFDRDARRLLFVNYWDSTLGTLPIGPSGNLCPATSGPLRLAKRMVAEKRADHLKQRQSEPHAHAIVLDPITSRIAYVPDLGVDTIRQLVYDPVDGTFTPAGEIPSGRADCKPLGPRYIEFHPSLSIAYVVNEISSQVSVFEFSEAEALALVSGEEGKHETLRLLQDVSTIPSAFPRALNTCGRICVDPTGKFVVVSNRGHDSIVVFRISTVMEHRGELSVVSYCHTRGRTPRHFQFDPTGKWLIAANQDTNHIVVFRFHSDTGELEYSGNYYDVPSPNFVCIHSLHDISRGTASL